MSGSNENGLIDLSDRVAIVTGSSGGIGHAIAEALLESGASVVVCGRDSEKVEQTTAAFTERFSAEKVSGTTCDIAEKDQIKELVEHAIKTFGQLDIVVGNAGSNFHVGPVLAATDDGYEKTMKLNVQSNLWLCQHAVPHLTKRPNASILFTASAAAFTTSDVLSVYGLSKLALLGLTRQLATELGPQGVNVNALCPSVIRTDFSKMMWQNEAMVADMSQRIPLNRLGEADDLKGIAALLVSEAGHYISGQAISVCGGEFVWN